MKVLRKKGRPPKAGPRHPNGERRHPDPADPEPRAVVMAQREKVVGPKHAADPRSGYLAGILVLWGVITPRQHEAALRLAGVLRAHSLLKAGALPLPAGMRIEMVPERIEARADYSPDPRTEEERVEATVRAWEACRVAMMSAGLQARALAEELAMTEGKDGLLWRGREEQVLLVQRALDAVADVFGLEREER